jgi:hypothetical protein
VIFGAPLPEGAVEKVIVEELPVARRFAIAGEEFLAPIVARCIAKVALLEKDFLPMMRDILDKVPDYLGPVFLKSPAARAAFGSYFRQLAGTFVVHYSSVAQMLALACLALIAFVGIPLLVTYCLRRSINVFVSFNRALEGIADGLQHALDAHGVGTIRIPYRADATHQEVVDSVSRGIKRSNAFLCIPGASATFVESEVLAASTSGKVLIFLLSEGDGTLPNTADKRYPIFKLEKTRSQDFQPLVRFVRYLGRDFASVAELSVRSLQEAVDFFLTSARGRAVVGVTLVLAAGYCYFDIYRRGYVTLSWAPANDARAAAILANTSLFFVLGLLAVSVVQYVGLVLFNRWKQSRTQKRATLEVAAATFNRDDWIGLVPGLEQNSPMYDCMFEGAALAHHELAHAPVSAG